MKTNFVSSLLLFIFSCVNLFSQSNNWQWARNAVGSSAHAISCSIVADDLGNEFITGQFHDQTIAFGPYTLINADPSQVTSDLFITKYDSAGNVSWSKRAGGAGYESGNSVAIDPMHNLLATGRFSSTTISFGSTTLNNMSSLYDLFIVKYNPNGNVIWAKGFGGTTNESGSSITTDNSGNIYVVGYFDSPMLSFDSHVLINNGGNHDAFLAKLDTSGNVIWAKSVGGSQHDEFSSVSIDGYANVYVTGQFQSSIVNVGSVTLTNSGNRDFMIAKYDSSGNVLWAKSAQGSTDDAGNSISADVGGSAYVTGYFISPSITFGSITLTNSGTQDAFIVKYDELGNVIWARNGLGAANSQGFSTSTDPIGNVYVTGGFGFNDTITFGTETLMPPAGSTAPLFLLKYDANGNVLCASALSGGGDIVNAVSADPFGNAYVTGDYWSNPFVVGNDTMQHYSQYDVFIAKYDCNNNVGINELGNNQGIHIFPNPTNGVFYLNFGISNGELLISNVLGEIVLHSELNGNSNQFDLSNQPTGIYFVMIISGAKIYAQKIIKN